MKRSRARHLLTLLLSVLVIGTVLSAAPAGAAGLHLKQGSRGAAVKTLETRLVKTAGLPRSAVDRRYRASTVRAVKRFQRARRLRVTGTVNQRTWNLVATAYRRATAPRPVARPPAWQRPSWAPPSVTAHRGGALESPEHTLVTIRRAVELGVHSVEFDLRSTADHQLVLLHDRTLDRTTDCTGEVFTRTLAEVQECRTDVGAQPVPTLDEVAGYLATTDVMLSPEIKDYGTDVDADELATFVQTVHAYGLSGRTFAQSFDPEVFPDLRALRRSGDPAMSLVYVSARAVSAEQVLAAGADVASIALSALTRTAIDAYHHLEIPVYTWTALNDTQLKAAWDLGVDSVVTDVPAAAMRLYP